MALPLINQPALGDIKNLREGGKTTGARNLPGDRNLPILFPECRRGVPSIYLAPRLVTGG